jgi:glycogen debranching enzyme
VYFSGNYGEGVEPPIGRCKPQAWASATLVKTIVCERVSARSDLPMQSSQASWYLSDLIASYKSPQIVKLMFRAGIMFVFW